MTKKLTAQPSTTAHAASIAKIVNDPDGYDFKLAMQALPTAERMLFDDLLTTIVSYGYLEPDSAVDLVHAAIDHRLEQLHEGKREAVTACPSIPVSNGGTTDPVTLFFDIPNAASAPAGRTLYVAVSTAARRLHELADALDHAASAVKDAASLEASLAPEITEEMVSRLTPAIQMATRLQDLRHIMREAAEETEARAQSLRSLPPAVPAQDAGRCSCGGCALRGRKRA